jgi:hypothetical protein
MEKPGTADRPALYVGIVVLTALAAAVYQLRATNIFACPAAGYEHNRFLAYCQAQHYGDYDHGAFWFDLEPDAAASLHNARVLFVGNSRLQWALSTPAVTQWFASARATYYLFGFAYSETYRFEAQVLQRLAPPASVYVINLDAFFRSTESSPAQFVMEDREALRRYQGKRLWQRIHNAVCRSVVTLCGREVAFFRSRDTGSYSGTPGPPRPGDVSADTMVDQGVLKQEVALGSAFLARLPVRRECVITTIVPTTNTKSALAAAISAELGTRLVAPTITDLHTIDGSHLDPASAQRWSQAFLAAAGPRMRSCLGASSGAAAAVQSLSSR